MILGHDKRGERVLLLQIYADIEKFRLTNLHDKTEPGLRFLGCCLFDAWWWRWWCPLIDARVMSGPPICGISWSLKSIVSPHCWHRRRLSDSLDSQLESAGIWALDGDCGIVLISFPELLSSHSYSQQSSSPITSNSSSSPRTSSIWR